MIDQGFSPAVLYEDNHCLVVMKPARLPVTADDSGDATLEDWSKAYIKEKYAKKGNVFLELAHRIDRPVSGVVLFARTSKAASRLTALFRERTVRKVYVALVEGKPPQASGELTDFLVKDRRTNVSRVCANDRDTDGDGGKPRQCHLRYHVLAAEGTGDQIRTLLAVYPTTGRSHQIRLQLSHAGWPIVGDRKYQARSDLGGWVALHSFGLAFKHPTEEREVSVQAPLPEIWRELASRAILDAAKALEV